MEVEEDAVSSDWVAKYICQEIELSGLKTGSGSGALDAMALSFSVHHIWQGFLTGSSVDCGFLNITTVTLVGI